MKKQILSLRKVRLASTSGHVIIVEPGIPTEIPEQLFVEAAKQGCVDYNKQMIDAFRVAMENAATEAEVSLAAPSIDLVDLVRQSLKQVLLADDKTLLTSAGVPRVPAVRAAYEVLCAQHKVASELKVTPELVTDLFLNLQGENEPVSNERYPVGVENDLDGDDEVGGVTDDLIERVTRE